MLFLKKILKKFKLGYGQVHQVVSAPARSTESYQINFHPVYFKT
jgi:hypothetical protein